MSDIFISYASADRERARVIADALTARGWSVWWDRVIPPGRQFDEVIEEALDAARCVVVLWSRASASSTWVKTEAAEAMSRKSLIPAIIEDVKIPLEFRRLQAADLSRWTGEPHDQQLEQFFESVEAAVGRAKPGGGGDPAPPPPEPVPPAPRPRTDPVPTPAPSQPRTDPVPTPAPSQPRTRKLSPAMIGGIVAVIVAALGTAYYMEHSKNAALAEQAERLRVEREADRERAARDDADKARRADSERRAAESRKPREIASSGQAQSDEATTNGAPREVPASGTTHVSWRDHALGYGGTLAWNPGGAMLQVAVKDLQTGTPIGNYAVPALVARMNAREYIVTAQFSVPGDSTTPGPHSHMSRLLFKAQNDGSIRLVRNCPNQGECY